MVKEIVVKETGNTPADMIRMAVSGGADLEKMEKLLALQERWEANEARKAFARDYAIVQTEIHSVVKKSSNPQTHSKYADLSAVIESARPVYTRSGFSIIFYEGKSDAQEHVRICADVLHIMGHKETFYYDVPLDGVGIKGNANMTKIHAKASSTSYARRYLMCMIWNIATSDDDGNAATIVPKITNEQLSTLRDILISIGDEKKEGAFCKFFGVTTLDELKSTDYQKALSTLNARKAQKESEKNASA